MRVPDQIAGDGSGDAHKIQVQSNDICKQSLCFLSWQTGESGVTKRVHLTPVCLSGCTTVFPRDTTHFFIPEDYRQTTYNVRKYTTEIG